MDIATIKERQQATWASGDYSAVGTRLLPTAELLCEAVDPALPERARRRARAEGLEVTFQEADAEDLPFGDGSFDVVLSTCGALFAPDQERTAAELLRVCRPGGRVGMVNWTPDSYVGELFRAIGRHLPPPPGLRPPVQWAARSGCGSCSAPRWPSRPPGAASAGGSPARRFDVSDDDTLVLRMDYLEAVIAKPATP
jgi:SAM-dependent methyltransferase